MAHFTYAVTMCIHNKLTHEVLCKYGGIESIAICKHLGSFLLPQVCGDHKELGIQSCFSRLPDCQETQ